MRSKLLLIFLATVAASQTVNNEREKPKLYQDPDAYDVYVALFSDSGSLQLNPVLVSQAAYGKQFCGTVKPELLATIGPAINDYTQASKTLWLLDDAHLNWHHRLLPYETQLTLFESGPDAGWTKFHDSFPADKGFFVLSPVSFNSEKSAAVVALDYRCGLLCGHGAFQFLKKTDGKWKKIDASASGCGWFY